MLRTFDSFRDVLVETKRFFEERKSRPVLDKNTKIIMLNNSLKSAGDEPSLNFFNRENSLGATEANEGGEKQNTSFGAGGVKRLGFGIKSKELDLIQAEGSQNSSKSNSSLPGNQKQKILQGFKNKGLAAVQPQIFPQKFKRQVEERVQSIVDKK